LVSGGMLLILGGGALLLFGCKMGIKFVCNLTGGKDILGGLGGGGSGDSGGDLNLDNLTPEQQAALKSKFGEQYPRVTLTEAMEFISNQVVSDIDKYTYQELGRNKVLNLKAQLLAHYKSFLQKIAEYNDMRLKPLEGRALAKYSLLILTVCKDNGIVLNPAAEAMMRANLFAGSPTLGQTTANIAFIVS